MSWIIEGSGETIVLQIDKTGNFSIAGTSNRVQIHPVVGDINQKFLSHIKNIDCHWDIYSINTKLASHGDALLKRAETNSMVPHVAVRYFNEQPPTIGVRILLPETHLLNTTRLFENVLKCSTLKYLISFDFDGFLADSPGNNVPTIEAFKAGDRFLCEGVKISFSRI